MTVCAKVQSLVVIYESIFTLACPACDDKGHVIIYITSNALNMNPCKKQ